MNQEEFHQYYESESDRVFNELNKLTEDQLLEIIANKGNNKYKIWSGQDNYQLWRALAIKGTQKSMQPLFTIVTDLKNEYLVRYHACNALFSIAKIPDDELKGEVQYGLNKNREKTDQQKAFDKLRSMLNMDANVGNVNPVIKKPWWKF